MRLLPVDHILAHMASVVAPLAFVLMEKSMLPDSITRMGIRNLLQARLEEEKQPNKSLQQERLMNFVRELKTMEIAKNTTEANAQHYEVPAELYDLMLGPFKKYSGALYLDNATDADADKLLGEAEDRMLRLYAERAGVTEDHSLRIMDMGCGWGSVSLWFAEHFPKSEIRGISNSNSQREYIMAQAEIRGLKNLKIFTGNIVSWELSDTGEANFDRIISVEMLEHMKNYEKLLGKVASWLKPDGKFFVHIFTHEEYAYHYEVTSDTDWMTKYFFAGGTMPSHDLLHYFQRDLSLVEHWKVNGRHYGLTSEAWLQNLDKNKDEAMKLLAKIYKDDPDGPDGLAQRWFSRWRAFFLSCAECFKFGTGDEWYVSHYLFERK